jgi:hypothetical protein
VHAQHWFLLVLGGFLFYKLLQWKLVGKVEYLEPYLLDLKISSKNQSFETGSLKKPVSSLKFSKAELKTKSKWEVRKLNKYCLHTHSYSGKYLKTVGCLQKIILTIPSKDYKSLQFKSNISQIKYSHEETSLNEGEHWRCVGGRCRFTLAQVGNQPEPRLSYSADLQFKWTLMEFVAAVLTSYSGFIEYNNFS